MFASSTPITSTTSNAVAYEGEDTVYQGESSTSLQDHLLWQMQLTPFSDTDQIISMAIIDSIDESGYLTTDCESILDSLKDDLENLELDEIEAVLKRIQH